MKIEMNIGGKSCVFFKDITPEERTYILSALKRITKDSAIIEKTTENLDAENRGTTISTDKRVMVLIGPQSSKSEFLNTLAHEVRHVVDSLDIDNVSPAQLTGEIFAHFADWV